MWQAHQEPCALPILAPAQRRRKTRKADPAQRVVVCVMAITMILAVASLYVATRRIFFGPAPMIMAVDLDAPTIEKKQDATAIESPKDAHLIHSLGTRAQFDGKEVLENGVLNDALPA